MDGILDSAEDVIGLAVQAHYAEDNVAAKKKLLEDDASPLPYWLGKFEQRLEENAERGAKIGYFVGDKLSIADLKTYSTFDILKMFMGEPAMALLKKYERITKFKGVMDADEKIKTTTSTFFIATPSAFFIDTATATCSARHTSSSEASFERPIGGATSTVKVRAVQQRRMG